MKHQWFARFSEHADLPGEAMPQLPLVELAGDSRVLVEQHRGLTAYGTENIRVRVRFGEISITGSGLHLVRMAREQLVISGKIDQISLNREAI